MFLSGKTEAVNLTANQYFNEAKNIESNPLTEANEEEKQASEALAAMKEVQPLHQQIAPLFEKISSGLSGMSKIVGGNTQPKDINAGTLAAFLSIKQSNENDIIVPLQQLNAIVSSHVQYMQSMYDNQKSQLEGLKKAIETLEQKVKATNDSCEKNESNSKIISQRSADILITIKELSPRITVAEREYFKDIQRFSANAEKLEEKYMDIQNGCKILSKGLNDARIELKTKALLTEEHKQHCEALLEGQRQKLTECEDSIQTSIRAIQSISSS